LGPASGKEGTYTSERLRLEIIIRRQKQLFDWTKGGRGFRIKKSKERGGLRERINNCIHEQRTGVKERERRGTQSSGKTREGGVPGELACHISALRKRKRSDWGNSPCQEKVLI